MILLFSDRNPEIRIATTNLLIGICQNNYSLLTTRNFLNNHIDNLIREIGNSDIRVMSKLILFFE
jgi:hypothetical protein